MPQSAKCSGPASGYEAREHSSSFITANSLVLVLHLCIEEVGTGNKSTCFRPSARYMRYAWYAIRGMQLHVIPSIIETQIETRWQMPELQRSQTPGCGPTQRFQAKSASLYQFFSAENCTVITFRVFQ